MDIWGALALIFVGAFLAMLLVAAFYWQAVRPRLMALARLTSPPPTPDLSPLGDRLQNAVNTLSESLVRHSALVSRLPTSFEVRGPAVESVADTLAAIQAAQREQHDRLAALEQKINTSLSLWSETLAGTLGAAQAGQEGIRLAIEQQTADLSNLQAALQAALTGQEHILAALEQQTADLIASQDALLPRLEGGPAALQALRGDLTALRSELAEQRQAIGEMQMLVAAFNAAQLDDITRLASLDERVARQEAQAAAQPQQAIRAPDLDGIRRLHKQIATLVRRTLTLNADVAAVLAALSRAEARLTHHEDVLTALRQQLEHALQGQQVQAGLLQALSQRDLPVQTVIREEKIIVQDRLQDIKGIGPVFSGILHERGIHSFRQLADLTPDELRALVNTPRWRAIDAESWIAQARLFASQKEKTEAAL